MDRPARHEHGAVAGWLRPGLPLALVACVVLIWIGTAAGPLAPARARRAAPVSAEGHTMNDVAPAVASTRQEYIMTTIPPVSPVHRRPVTA